MFSAVPSMCCMETISGIPKTNFDKIIVEDWRCFTTEECFIKLLLRYLRVFLNLKNKKKLNSVTTKSLRVIL
jgi:hypothetical protein